MSHYIIDGREITPPLYHIAHHLVSSGVSITFSTNWSVRFGIQAEISIDCWPNECTFHLNRCATELDLAAGIIKRSDEIGKILADIKVDYNDPMCFYKIDQFVHDQMLHGANTVRFKYGLDAIESAIAQLKVRIYETEFNTP